LGILAVEQLSTLAPSSGPVIWGILVLVTGLFFVPSAILGTVSPIVVKLAVRDLEETGRTVGKIYAAGAVGSIVGTFATGFVLISWFGTYTIVWGVALLLVILGLVFVLSSQPRWWLAAGLFLASISVIVGSWQWVQSPCTLETNYFCIKVEEQERNGEPVRVLILDRLLHSFTSLNDPTLLVYGYEKMYAEVTAYRAERDDQLRALFIGGGGYTFPRYMEALYPNSELDVIEIDPGVTQIARDLLGLERDTGIVTYNQDARTFLEQTPIKHYDLVFGDAFNDFSVPYHLTTKEFNDRVRAWLVDDGIYLVNIIDGWRGEFLRAYVHTLRQSFRYVYVAPTSTEWREALHTTFVIIGTDAPLDLEAFERTIAGDNTTYLTRQLLEESELTEVMNKGRVTTLTDQYAPVDQMLAPMFRDEMVE
jgi:spermidine synthase